MLAVTMTNLGLPVPIYAADEPEQPATRTAVITLGGQTLGQFLRTTVRPAGGLSLAAFAPGGYRQPLNGQISGVALSRRGRPLRGRRVELRLPGPNQPGAPFRRPGSGSRLVTVTDVQGRFSFTGLGPGRYVVELSAGGEVATVPVTLSEDAMVVTGITVSEPPNSPGVSRRRQLFLGLGIGALGVLFYFALPREDAAIPDELDVGAGAPPFR